MAKPDTPKSNTDNSPSLIVLKELVLPAFERKTGPIHDEIAFQFFEPEADTIEAPSVRGIFPGKGPISVFASNIDEERVSLRISWLAGYLIADYPTDAVIVGNLLERTPFHVRSECPFGISGRLTIGCDLVARIDDASLVELRLGELFKLAGALEWFFPLRLPHRLDWQDIGAFEIDWMDLPHHDLGGFLDDGLSAPPSERTPVTLLRIAQGLQRWKDVLQILHEHPEELPPKEWAPLKCAALRQLKRWMPAIRAAKAGGIQKGRFPGAKWRNSSYLHSLIEGGDEIEALCLLGQTRVGEPAVYRWFRGLAMHRAGVEKQAKKSFSQYESAWPGDVLAAVEIHELGLGIE
ncbi:MAG: hypothetical protein ACSHX9_00305 [Luteolibacter sp.]